MTNALSQYFETLDIQHMFAFINYEEFGLIFGLTVEFASEFDQGIFDTGLQQIETFAQAGVKLAAVEGLNVREAEALVGLEDIGNVSSGVTFVLEAEGAFLRLDLIGFRRGIVGAVVEVVYQEGEEPLMSVKDLAQLLDSRIAASLAED